MVQVFIIIAALFTACPGGKAMAENNPYFRTVQDVPLSAWQALATKRIFFGHQSVGNNILDGVKELMQENGQINLQISKATPGEISSIPSIFAHSYIGRNGEPTSKIDEFVAIFARNDVEMDLAFFKFCYIDFDGKTDPKDLFEYYKTAMFRLQQDHPGTTFMHVTVPLVVSPDGARQRIKDWLKESLGRPTNASLNAKRNRFNELLRREYQGKALIFDLAEIQSTSPDGKRVSFTLGGNTYHSMAPAYSDDGGHLNEKGRRTVAERFLVFLASVPQVSEKSRRFDALTIE